MEKQSARAQKKNIRIHKIQWKQDANAQQEHKIHFSERKKNKEMRFDQLLCKSKMSDMCLNEIEWLLSFSRCWRCQIWRHECNVTLCMRSRVMYHSFLSQVSHGLMDDRPFSIHWHFELRLDSDAPEKFFRYGKKIGTYVLIYTRMYIA